MRGFAKLGRCDLDHGMGALDGNCSVNAGLRQICVEACEIAARIGRLDRHLSLAVGRAAIDRDTGGIRSAIGHGDQHIRQQIPQTGLQRLVFQEQTHNAAHGRDLHFLMETDLAVAKNKINQRE